MIVRVLSAGRAAFGLALLLFPRPMSTLMWGAGSGGPAARLFARGGGARDLALGAATALRCERADLLWLSVACDAADCIVTVADGRDVPRLRRLIIATGAGTMAVTHALLARRVIRPSTG